MRPALHAEWTKIRTVASPLWLALGTIAATVALSAAVTSVDDLRLPAGCGGDDTTKLSLTGVELGQALVAILAVLVISGEYSSGMIRTTLTALPHRATVLAAKAVTLTGVVARGRDRRGTRVAHGWAAHPARPWLHDCPRLPGPVPGRRATLRAAIGSILYLALIALLSLGVAHRSYGTPPPASGSSSACSTLSPSSPR